MIRSRTPARPSRRSSPIFGEDVASLVDGVTKLSRIPYSSKEEIQAENFRKMFLAMARDIRVVLIKLADRLHNMRTMRHMSPEKQQEKARETLDIYAPLAHRLGIYKIKWELEDLCLRYIDRDAYYELVGSISQKRSEREHYLQEIVVQLQVKIREMGIKAEIEGRPKHFYSIYRKMKNQDKSLDQIYDLFATRDHCRYRRPTAMRSSVWFMSSTSRCPAASRTTSPCPSPTCTSRCTRR